MAVFFGGILKPAEKSVQLYNRNINYMTPINRQTLIQFGMKPTNDPVIPLTKDLISDEWKRDNPEECDNVTLAISLTQERNTPELALFTSDGVLFLRPRSIEDLKAFERCIESYSSHI